MEKSQDLIALIGRIAVAILFVTSGWGKMMDFGGTAGFIASNGIPLPQVATAITIVEELGLGLAIALGWQTRYAAAVIALWLIPTTFLFHNFWSAPADQVMMQQINFMKNVSIFGAMLLLMAFGPGRYSLDGRGRA
ncbi:MAG: DoxX family protein [Betaproteobacteria bacterium]